MKPLYKEYADMAAKALIEQDEDLYYSIDDTAYTNLEPEMYNKYQQYTSDIIKLYETGRWPEDETFI